MSTRGSRIQLPAQARIDWHQLLFHYDSRHRPKRRCELDWFAEQATLDRVIYLAAHAEGRGKKRLDHQRRISQAAIPIAASSLAAHAQAIGAADSFEQLLKIVDDAARHIWGIGELYCYDAALRLGAYLKIAPDRVYLHAGTRKGARALVEIARNEPWIAVSDLPRPLRLRSAGEIENILCVYKDAFATGILPSDSCG